MNDFRDTRLFELTAPVAEIEERGTNHFILRQAAGTTNWSIAGEKFPADAATVQLFIKRLAGLRILRFVNDVVTAPDLPAYGLDAPRREIILRAKAGDTNSVIADLQFGLTRTNEVFVRCGGEDSIYAISAEEFNLLQDAAWEFRDRLIWDFKPDDVAQITIHQGDKTRQLVQNSPGKWSLAAGSQGFIEDKYIEQAVQMFHDLAAISWVPRELQRAGLRFRHEQPANCVRTQKQRKACGGFRRYRGPAAGAECAGRRHARRRAVGVPLSAGALPARVELSHHSVKRAVICDPASGANAARASAGSAAR